MRGVVAIVARDDSTPASGVTAASGHGHAALGAELRTLRLHAGGRPRHVGDGVAAEPHRIGRTGLLHIDRHLGPSSAQAAEKKCADRQCQPANEENGSHLVFPGVAKFDRRKGK